MLFHITLCLSVRKGFRACSHHVYICHCMLSVSGRLTPPHVYIYASGLGSTISTYVIILWFKYGSKVDSRMRKKLCLSPAQTRGLYLQVTLWKHFDTLSVCPSEPQKQSLTHLLEMTAMQWPTLLRPWSYHTYIHLSIFEPQWLSPSKYTSVPTL